MYDSFSQEASVASEDIDAAILDTFIENNFLENNTDISGELPVQVYNNNTNYNTYSEGEGLDDYLDSMTGNNNNGDGLDESEQGKAIERDYVRDSGKANGVDDGEEESDSGSDSVLEVAGIDDDDGDMKSIHRKAKRLVKLTPKLKARNRRAAYCWTVVHRAHILPKDMTKLKKYDRAAWDLAKKRCKVNKKNSGNCMLAHSAWQTTLCL